MKKQFTLDYWMDDGWHVGKLREVPNVYVSGRLPQEYGWRNNTEYSDLPGNP